MVDKKGMKFLHPCSELVPPVALEEFARCKEQKLVIASQLFLSLGSNRTVGLYCASAFGDRPGALCLQLA